MQKKQLWILLTILIVLVVGINSYYQRNQLVFTPQTFPGTIETYSDSSLDARNGGASISLIDSVTTKGLSYRYKLNSQFAYYYAGIRCIVSKPHTFDLSQYSHVSVTLKSSHAKSCRLILLTDEPNYTLRNDPTTYRHFKQMFPLRQGINTYTVEMHHFVTPQWWFDTYNTTENQLTKAPFTHTIGFKIESGEGEETDYWEEMQLKEIRFYTPVPLWIRGVQLLLLFTALIILGFVFGLFRPIQIGKYTPIVLGNRFDTELEEITTYLGTHYSNPLLSLGKVAEEIALHPDKVAALIKQGYGQTFKQYLNHLRLTEAQRLLRSTDRQISEIAYAVGYSSVTHFNRVFKQQFACTPREYRS